MDSSKEGSDFDFNHSSNIQVRLFSFFLYNYLKPKCYYKIYIHYTNHIGMCLCNRLKIGLSTINLT